MMLTIYGLPKNIKYSELKTLIKQKCNITQFILDNLVYDADGAKKVRIGLADDTEGSIFMKCLDGYRLDGSVLRIVPIVKATQQGNPQQGESSSYQWRDNQQGQTYGEHSVDINTNPVNPWAAGSQQWVPNQAQNLVQIQPHTNFGYVQQAQSVQPFIQQQVQQPQSNPFVQDVFLQGTGMMAPRVEQPRGQTLRDIGISSNLTGALASNVGDLQYASQKFVAPDKPITIMKDNFQGPTQYSFGQPVNQRSECYDSYGSGQSSWTAQKQESFNKPNAPGFDGDKYEPEQNHLRQISPSDRRISPSNQRNARRLHLSPSERRISPSHHNASPRESRILPSGRRVSPSGRRVSPSDRSSPPGRRFSQSERRISPPRRRISPAARRISPPGRRMSPPGRRISPSGRKISPSERRISPSGRKVPSPERRISSSGRNSPSRRKFSPPVRKTSPPGRRVSPYGRRNSPTRRRVSPPGRTIFQSERRVSPPGRRISPSVRIISPSARRMSPPGRRISPPIRRISPPVRRISPSGRRISPSERRISPSGRKISPSGRRGSPIERKDSQGHVTGRLSPRRMSPQMLMGTNRAPSPRVYRYSPPPNENPLDTNKNVRPAYEQAPNQTKYSGGYRQNVHENVQYQGKQRQSWHQEKDKPYIASIKLDDIRREASRMHLFDIPRVSDYPRGLLNPSESKTLSSTRVSRSPNRRDRSPIRERSRRHSPSPRSPRRSWALEKRRSPPIQEPPPPPLWPSQNIQKDKYQKQNWSEFDGDKRQKPRQPVWEKHDRVEDEHKCFVSPERSRWGKGPVMSARDVIIGESSSRSLRPNERFSEIQRGPHFSPRDDFDNHKRDMFRRTEMSDREPRLGEREKTDFKRQENLDNRRKFESQLKTSDFTRRPDNTEASDPHRLNEKNLSKQMEDVMKRAAEFTKKIQQYRKSEDRKNEAYANEFTSRADAEVQVKTSAYKNAAREGPSHRFTKLDKNDQYEPSDVFDTDPEYSHHIDKFDLSPAVQYKRDKAVDEITGKLVHKFAPDLKGRMREQVEERLQGTIENLVNKMFRNQDVPFIEIVIKFEDRYSKRDLQNIFDQVMSEFPNEYRAMKRSAPEEPQIPVKTPRTSSNDTFHRDLGETVQPQISDWNMGVAPLGTPALVVPQMAAMSSLSVMVAETSEPVIPNPMQPVDEGFSLFICKDDFQPFNDQQADFIKSFIITKMLQETESSNAWAPDITFKGVQNQFRYEIWTGDEKSRDWIDNLDFTNFAYFNVLVYTSEELWFERAAIWLPGHSKCRIISPIMKIKLQNRHLEGVQINKWKLVKEIITEKGMRLYVDIPSSSAQALQKYNMSLSFELQKVSVFRRADAVDKVAFDAGLNERSIKLTTDLQNQQAPMPFLDTPDPDIVRIALNKEQHITKVSVNTARKMKDQIIYNLFKYLQKGGKSKVDFIKYGFCKGYLCLHPENLETKNWLINQYLGAIKKMSICAIEGDNTNIKYINVQMVLPREQLLTPKLIIMKLKKKNPDINYTLWKDGKITDLPRSSKVKFSIDIDLESAKKLLDISFTVDYPYCNSIRTVFIEADISMRDLKELINRYEAEQKDSFDVTNMDLDSSSDDVIFFE